MTDPTNQAPAPGWYPDASGTQRWWDGRGWTDHVAGVAPVAPVFARPALPEGTKVDTAWVWVVSLGFLIACIPLFFFDFGGYLREMMYLGSDPGVPFAGMTGGFIVYYLLLIVLGWGTYALLVVAAFRDYKHLAALGVVRPFHWAFAFIAATVYLIGRHVVLRKVVRTSGAPLWVHIAAYVVFMIVYFAWIMLLVTSLISELPAYVDTYGTYS